MEESEQLGRKQTPETRRKIAKAMSGKNNPAWKDGRRGYRNIANAKPGEHVHHRDGDKTNNVKSNLEKFPESGAGRSEHEKKHDRARNFNGDGSGRKYRGTAYTAKRLKR